MEAGFSPRLSARRWLFAFATLAGGIALGAQPAQALVINATFDSSITASPYASLIESDFSKAEAVYERAFKTPVTVNVEIGWGSVDGKAMKGGALGTTVDNLYGYFNYSQIAGYLKADAKSNTADLALKQAVASLPSSVSGEQDFAVSSSEAKALGIIPGTLPGEDAYIGFSSTAAFD